MNYPQGIFDLEALVNSQRSAAPLSNFPSTSRSLPYSANLAKEPQNFPASMGYYPNQPLRANSREEQEFMMYDPSLLARAEENSRYQYPNNNNLLDYMQPRKPQNNPQYMSANQQLAGMRPDRALMENNHNKRGILPQNLNVLQGSLPPGFDLSSLESEETLAQILNPRANMMQSANRSLPYSAQSEDQINQAALLNSLKMNQDFLLPQLSSQLSQLSQLPLDNLYGINELDTVANLNPLLLKAMYANTSIDNLYKQMQMELLSSGLPSGLTPDQQLMLQLGQNLPQTSGINPQSLSMLQMHGAEPILIDDSPDLDLYPYLAMNAMNPMNFEKDRRSVKEEFMGKPMRQQYQPFQEIDDRRISEMAGQYMDESWRNRQGPVGTNLGKRFMDQEAQLMGYPPEKKIETSAGKGVRANMNVGISQPEKKYDIKSMQMQKEMKKPPPQKIEKPMPYMNKERPMTEREDIPVKQQIPMGVLPQPVKRPENVIQDFKRENKQAEMLPMRPKEPVATNVIKKVLPQTLQQPQPQAPKIMIDKISFPEGANLLPPEPMDFPLATAKQSPTTLHLHKKHGQIQLNAQQADFGNQQHAPLPAKPMYNSTIKLDLMTPTFNEQQQVPYPMSHPMSNPLSVNQSPEKTMMATRETSSQWTTIEPIEDRRADDFTLPMLVPNKEKAAVGRKKKPEPVVEAIIEPPGRRERKMNKLQLLRTAYQTYLEDLRKPYKISIHIDPTNPDEKIVSAKIGEGFQCDVDQALNTLAYKVKHPVKSTWSPDSFTPRMLEEYYARFGQIIGQRVTNEEAALKNLARFEMDIEKALDNVKKNQLYFQNSFRLDQRVLRNRVSHNS